MEISIEKESQRFFDFIQEEGNNNIIFSGIYGIGKSFFINNFFNKKYKDKYIPIFLTPVNYSVANNEDIFEYIKTDILLQLLENVPCDLNNCQISTSVATYYYIKNHVNTIIGNILSTAEKICFQTDILERLFTLMGNIKEFQEENSKNENKEIEKFITELSQKKGSIYESDIITQIIQTIISNAKKESPKEAILIIDDLDRIDPEHIFRILNIFSAHNDFNKNNEHKFKFDKTILVCDIENIRKIFHAKYGANVDFCGYIDKFYSKEIYHFNNVDEIAKCVARQVIKINSDSDISNEGQYSYINLVFILKHLIKYNLINIRTLQKFEFNYNLGNEYVSYYDSRYTIIRSPALIIFEFLKRISGSPETLISKLKTLSNYISYDEYDTIYIAECFIILAGLNEHNTIERKSAMLSYKGINYSIGSYMPMLIANIDYQTLNKSLYFKMIYDAYSNYLTYFNK